MHSVFIGQALKAYSVSFEDGMCFLASLLLITRGLTEGQFAKLCSDVYTLPPTSEEYAAGCKSILEVVKSGKMGYEKDVQTVLYEYVGDITRERQDKVSEMLSKLDRDQLIEVLED